MQTCTIMKWHDEMTSICLLHLAPPPKKKDWRLEKFTGFKNSFMVNYNVLDKVWLLLGNRPGDARVTELEPVHSGPSSLVLLPSPVLTFLPLNYSVGSFIHDLPVHFKHLCW